MEQDFVTFNSLEAGRIVRILVEELNCRDLRYCDFTGRWLSYINFQGSNISYSQFCHAGVIGGNFHSVTGHKAVFYKADLHISNFSCADLRGANFIGANLQDVDFRSTNLAGAVFTDADIKGAWFDGAEGIENANGLHWPQPVPGFVGYKMIQLANGERAVAELGVPEEARVVRGLGSDIIRADRALVMSIRDSAGNLRVEGKSFRDPECIYRVGQLVTPHHAFDADIRKVCGSGIHLFRTRAEAESF